MPAPPEALATVADVRAAPEEQLASVVETSQVCAVAYDRLARQLPPQLAWRSQRAGEQIRSTLSECFEVKTNAGTD